MPDVQSVTLGQSSMFAATPVYKSRGDIVFGLRRQKVFHDATDSVYTVVEGSANKLDTIAYAAYGNQNLWWVIAECNSMVDPLSQLPVGTQLWIPATSRLSGLNIS